MPAYGGYAGKVIKIDLSGETISEYPWGGREQALYLGGEAMAARILCDHLTGCETAFSEENWVVITTGPLTGTGAPGSARFDIAALSPKDDLPAFSNCGGNFGVYLKKAGYDAMILTGRCRENRWLEIHEDGITFHDAKELWGAGTGECQKKLAALLGTDRFGQLCIGPAGENLVKFASVVADGHTAGRAGIGAVLGWKNLKAITVSADKEIPIHAQEKAAALNREWQDAMKRHTKPDQDGTCRCDGCPLRCRKHNRGEDSRMDELGMDVIGAADAAQWAQEQGLAAADIYGDIAYRRGIGDKLAEGVPHRKGKGGKRRGGSNRAIAQAFGLPVDDPETDIFCRALTEAISAAGQCLFTVNILPLMEPGPPMRYVSTMLALVTGMETDLDGLLRIGKRSQSLVQQLLHRFS